MSNAISESEQDLIQCQSSENPALKKKSNYKSNTSMNFDTI